MWSKHEKETQRTAILLLSLVGMLPFCQWYSLTKKHDYYPGKSILCTKKKRGLPFKLSLLPTNVARVLFWNINSKICNRGHPFSFLLCATNSSFHLPVHNLSLSLTTPSLRTYSSSLYRQGNLTLYQTFYPCSKLLNVRRVQTRT